MFKSTFLLAALSVSCLGEGYILDKKDLAHPNGTKVISTTKFSMLGIKLAVTAGGNKMNGEMKMETIEVESFLIKSPEVTERILTKATQDQTMTMEGNQMPTAVPKKIFLNVPVTITEKDGKFTATVDLERELTAAEQEELKNVAHSFEVDALSAYGYEERALGESWDLGKEEALQLMGSADGIDDAEGTLTLVSVEENVATLKAKLKASGEAGDGMALGMEGSFVIKRDLELYLDAEVKGDFEVSFEMDTPGVQMNGTGPATMEYSEKVEIPAAK